MYGNARYYYHNMSNTNEVVFSDSYAKIVGDLGRSVSADVSISKIIIQNCCILFPSGHKIKNINGSKGSRF